MSYNKEYYKNKAKERERRIAKQLALKQEMFTVLGDKCACCFEQNKAFLTLDHINNDGFLERAKSAGGIREKAKRTGWDKTKYQILCYNCNMGKAHNKGICPHLRYSDSKIIGQQCH